MTVDPGKNFIGQRGFPTPNSAPDSTGYRVFRFPDNDDWVGLLMGAIEALQHEYNYYKWGAMTEAETVAAINQIVLESYTNTCGCNNPSGGKIIRIGSDGHVEELGEDGAWGAPTGDYAIPAITPREGGTPEDQICLAATNAADVLQQVYENLSDSWNTHLSEAEAQTALVLLLIALIGAAFAPITFGIVTFFGWLFGVLYETLEFVGADLWDETFTQALVCILVGCATNVDGVVTFDYTCVTNALAKQVNVFDLTVSQLRLFGQITFMLNSIGGADALNVAGATTGITTADCTGCYGCSIFDFATADYADSFTFVTPNDPWSYVDFGTVGAWFCSTGIQSMELVIPSGAALHGVYVKYGLVAAGIAQLLINGTVVQERTSVGTYTFETNVLPGDTLKIVLNCDTGGSNVQIWSLTWTEDNPWPDVPLC